MSGTKLEMPSPTAIAVARLPHSYFNAKQALAGCERIDEVKEMADQAQAIANYARMAKDDSLRVLADKIQARAERRMGQPLKHHDAQGQAQ